MGDARRGGTTVRRMSPHKAHRPARSPERPRHVSPLHPNTANGGRGSRMLIDTTLDWADLAVGLLLLSLVYMYFESSSPPDPIVVLEEAAPATALGTLAGFFKRLRFKPPWPLAG